MEVKRRIRKARISPRFQLTLWLVERVEASRNGAG